MQGEYHGNGQIGVAGHHRPADKEETEKEQQGAFDRREAFLFQVTIEIESSPDDEEGQRGIGIHVDAVQHDQGDGREEYQERADHGGPFIADTFEQDIGHDHHAERQQDAAPARDAEELEGNEVKNDAGGFFERPFVVGDGQVLEEVTAVADGLLRLPVLGKVVDSEVAGGEIADAVVVSPVVRVRHPERSYQDQDGGEDEAERGHRPVNVDMTVKGLCLWGGDFTHELLPVMLDKIPQRGR